MRIEVNLYASLAPYLPRIEGAAGSRVREVDEGTTILGLLRLYQVPADQVKLIFLNGIHAGGDEVLHDGDRLGVFPPIAGG
jgi:molybdopterin converting factor small subunit